MKPTKFIIFGLFSLITALVVSSFAWFQLKNNGLISTTIPTNQQVAIYFDQDGTSGEAMKPAVLKKGVINDPSGSILGTGNEASIIVPKAEGVLPLKDGNYDYVSEGGKLVSGSEYLDSPATIVYSQFKVQASNDNGNVETKDINLEFDVRYFNVGSDTSDIEVAVPFTQTEALTFNFFVLETEISKENLLTLSTNIEEGSSNVTIEKYLVDNEVLVRKNGESVRIGEYSSVKNYRYETSFKKDEHGKDTSVYTVTFENLSCNTTYYILIESYYSVPDQLIKGNLPLTGEFVLNLTYSPTNNVVN